MPTLLAQTEIPDSQGIPFVDKHLPSGTLPRVIERLKQWLGHSDARQVSDLPSMSASSLRV
jgi:hypothetical protein